MALLRFDSGIGGLLSLQDELERFMRNPAFGMGLSGYEAGLLIVRVPRAEHAVARQIAVKTA